MGEQELDRDCARTKVGVDVVDDAAAPDGNPGAFDGAGGVAEDGAQVDRDRIAEGEAPVKRPPNFEVSRLRSVTPDDVYRTVVRAERVSVDCDSGFLRSRYVERHRVLVGLR